MTDRDFILERLYDVIGERRGGDPAVSMTARLFERGRGKICQKFGEEAVETIVAALNETPERVVSESADLFYYLLILWAETGVRPEDVWAELESREGISGVERRAVKKADDGNAGDGPEPRK